MRLAFLQIHDAPYRMDFLRYLAKNKTVDLTVYTYKPDDSHHLYWDLKNFGYTSLALGPSLRMGPSLLHVKLLNPFFLKRYDRVAVMAHSNMTSLLAFFWCRIWKIPYVYMADTVEERMTSWLMRKIKAAIYLHAAFLFVTGHVSKRFFIETYGVPDEKILIGYYNFDYETIRGLAREGMLQRGNMRAQLGVLPSDTLSVMVANFLPFRDHLSLIKQFDYESGNKLLLIGEGECLTSCKIYVEQQVLKDKVLFMPGLSFEAMIRLLPVCDVYVHSGKEPYSTMPLLARLAGLRLGFHGDVPAFEDLKGDSVPCDFDSQEVAEQFVAACKNYT